MTIHKQPEVCAVTGQAVNWNEGHLTPTEDFDYDEIDRRLGFDEPDAQAIAGWSTMKLNHCADGLSELVHWLSNSDDIHSMGLRALALCWILHPENFPHKSAAALAARHGFTRAAINKYMTQVFRLGNARLLLPGRLYNTEAQRNIEQSRAEGVHGRLGHKRQVQPRQRHSPQREGIATRILQVKTYPRTKR